MTPLLLNDNWINEPWCSLFASLGDYWWLSRGCVVPLLFENPWSGHSSLILPALLSSPLSFALSGSAWQDCSNTQAYPCIPCCTSPSTLYLSLCLLFPIVCMCPEGQVCCQGASPLVSFPPKCGEGWLTEDADCDPLSCRQDSMLIAC